MNAGQIMALESDVLTDTYDFAVRRHPAGGWNALDMSERVIGTYVTENDAWDACRERLCDVQEAEAADGDVDAAHDRRVEGW